MRRFINLVEMVNPLLVEGRDAPLFHALDAYKAIPTLLKDELAASWTHDIPTAPETRLQGTSFTRDGKLDWHHYPVLFTADQAKLTQTNRIVPVDGHRVFQHTRGRYGWEEVRSRTGQGGAGTDPKEEFVVGPIKRLHRYLTHIAIVREPGGHERAAFLLHIVKAYGEKWGIPTTIAPEAIAALPRVAEREGMTPAETMHPDTQKWFPDYRPDALLALAFPSSGGQRALERKP